MKKRIIFIVEKIFNDRDYVRYSINFLLENNYEVKIWDFTPLLRPNRFNNPDNSDGVKEQRRILVRSRTEAIDYLTSLQKSDVVICLIRQSLKNFFIFRKLKKSKCYYGTLWVGVIPEYFRYYSKLEKINAHVNNLIRDPKSVVYALIRDFLYSFNFHFRFIFYGGAMAYSEISKESTLKNSVKINAHTLDYDIFLESHNEKEQQFKNRQYAVFLDAFIPYHPDNNIDRNEITVSADKYYPELNKFFNKIEEVLKLKVIIACHPKSNYNTIGNPFEGRELIYGKTSLLVKYSKLVISHASTANNFTVLYNKPVLFVNSSNYSKNYQKYITFFSSILGKRDIDISKRYQINFNEYLPDQTIYNKYINNYIKEENSPGLPFWEIFMDHIKYKS